MRWGHRWLIAVLVVLLPVLGPGGAYPAGATPAARGAAPGQCLVWEVVPAPQGQGYDQVVGGLAPVASGDVWAVGNRGNSNVRLPFTMHWDGLEWQAVPVANGDLPLTYLIGASALVSDNVWAAGYSTDQLVAPTASHTLIEHWNGMEWTVVTSTNPLRDGAPAFNFNELYAIDAVAANDIWAVGRSSNFTTGYTLVEHWDGANWSVVPAPQPGTYSELRAVAAVAPNDVWAAGAFMAGGLQRTLFLHWNGTTWMGVLSPNVGPYHNTLLGLTAIAPDDVWAVGYHLALIGTSQVYQTSTLHWDGASWSVIPSPNATPLNNYLYGITGLSANDVWAVGFFDTGTELLTMIQHWDGTQWSIVNSPNPGQVINELVSVAAVGPDDIWATGQAWDGFNYQPLVLHYHNTCTQERIYLPVALWQ